MQICPDHGVALVEEREDGQSASVSDTRTGTVLQGRYRVLRVVADGGTGRVYEALDLVDSRHVAIKIIHAEVAEDRVALQRYEREFDVSQQVHGDHVVETLDLLQVDDGLLAIVMEFLDGEELRGVLLREGVLHPARVVRIASQLAIALDEAHGYDYVHRDVKPDNVYLCERGGGDWVKLLDFGSVRVPEDRASRITMYGTTIGSPYYMAPEQVEGRDELDGRVDVWGLAVVCYECLCGSVPFAASEASAALVSIVRHVPTALSKAAERGGQAQRIPKAVDQVFAQAFAKSPSMRHPTAGDFVNRLGAALGLKGTFEKWAYEPLVELEETVDARVDDVPEATEPLPGTTSVWQDAIFQDLEEESRVSDVASGDRVVPVAPLQVPQRTHLPKKWVVTTAVVAMVLVLLVVVAVVAVLVAYVLD